MTLGTYLGRDPLPKNSGYEGCLKLDTCIICSLYPQEITAHIRTPSFEQVCYLTTQGQSASVRRRPKQGRTLLSKRVSAEMLPLSSVRTRRPTACSTRARGSRT